MKKAEKKFCGRAVVTFATVIALDFGLYIAGYVELAAPCYCLVNSYILMLFYLFFGGEEYQLTDT